MNRQKRYWTWIIFIALVTVSALGYSFNAALAVPPIARPTMATHRDRTLWPILPAATSGGYWPPAPWKAWDRPRRVKSGSTLQAAGWPCLRLLERALISGTERSGSLIPLLRRKAPNGSLGIGPQWLDRGHWAAHVAPRPGAHWVPDIGPKGHWKPGHWK